jgi:hypothetical protein
VKLEKRESSAFKKKRAKKRLLCWVLLVKPPLAQVNKSFLLLFFKKEALRFELLNVVRRRVDLELDRQQ